MAVRKELFFSCLIVWAVLLKPGNTEAQDEVVSFGKSLRMENVLAGEFEKAEPVKWFQVNTESDTWKVEGNLLKCFGLPIGVIRSEKEYENFIMHIEWSHQEAGGNSGTFVWSKAQPGENRLPDGVEVQMLDLEWVKLNTRDGKTPPIAYVHGELFGVGGVEITPENPRGKRSKSIENRVLGKKEWNTYDVVCVDGNIKLSVNGKYVNGITNSSQTKGYICLEAEGAEIHFRNIQIIELD
uniref:3-keto-disaccharide hydrolase n=1 Tax=uncultured Draconibacterium sp. TaxID=1573823 RepID=UPI0032173356